MAVFHLKRFFRLDEPQLFDHRSPTEIVFRGVVRFPFGGEMHFYGLKRARLHKLDQIHPAKECCRTRQKEEWGTLPQEKFLDALRLWNDQISFVDNPRTGLGLKPMQQNPLQEKN